MMPLPVLPGLADLGNALLGSTVLSQTLKAAKTTSNAATDVPTVTDAPVVTLSSIDSPTDTPTTSKAKPSTQILSTPTPQTEAPTLQATSVVDGPVPQDTTIFDTVTSSLAPTVVAPPPAPASKTKSRSRSPKSSPSETFSISVASSDSPQSAPTLIPFPFASDSSDVQSFTTLTTGLGPQTTPLLTPTDDGSGVPTPTPKPTAGLIAPNEANKPGDQPHGKSKTGSVVGGVIGALCAVALLAFLAFFLFKWLKRRREQRNSRSSFGPYGNGIDASNGSALVSSLPPKESPPMTEFDRNDYTRYARPNTTPRIPDIPDLAPIAPLRPLMPRNLSTIEDMSERGSTDVSSMLEMRRSLKVLNPDANPFDDSHAIRDLEKKQPTLPSVSIAEEPAPISPIHGPTTTGAAVGAVAVGSAAAGAAAARAASRSPTRPNRSQSLDENKGGHGVPEQRTWNNTGLPGPPPAFAAPPPRGMPPPRSRGMYDPNRPQGPPGPGTYKYPSIRDRYPPNRMGNGPAPYPARRRRSASVDQTYPRNPVLDSPSWQRWAGPPPARGVGPRNQTYSPPEQQNGEQTLHRRPSAASIRERPSPSNWDPLEGSQQASQQAPMMMRPGAAQSQPDLHTYSATSPTADHRIYGHLGGRGAAARNF